ncbi:hypothetical protein [Paracidovorax avenae]|uniref:hypothetical protein n=1 Tax=Paracidovorax avenae TaxID=80867 RepID=UPI001CEFAAB4|nr:hypothetical protein [Paracidovorax avenae]
MFISEDHPKQVLLFYVAQEVNESLRTSIRQLVEELASSRSWVIAPPRFVDAQDADSPAIETLGGELEIYSAVAPVKIPREIDIQHFEEVSWVIDFIKRFSSKFGLVFEFQLDGEFVGAIEDGELDRSLSVGLLGEWKRVLDGYN